MRTIAAAALVTLLLAPATLAKTKEFHTVAPLGAGGRVSVDSHNGTVSVVAWNQSNVGVDASIEPGRGSDHPDDVDRTKIKVTTSGANVDIVSDYSEVETHVSLFGFTRILPLVHYTIHVPATAALKVDVHNATVKVSGLHGDVSLQTHNGDIEAADLDGAAAIETHNGSIRLAYANFSKPGRIETHNGSVDVFVPATTRMSVRVDGHRDNPFSSNLPVTVKGHGSVSTAEVNGGGAELRFITHNGSLRLAKR